MVEAMNPPIRGEKVYPKDVDADQIAKTPIIFPEGADFSKYIQIAGLLRKVPYIIIGIAN